MSSSPIPPVHANGLSSAAERKDSVARWSILASAVLTLGKLFAGILSGSLALLSEAAHSFVDTLATFVTWVAIRISHKPADDEHHYGHGKIESMAALVETGVLLALALGVLAAAVKRFFAGTIAIETSPVIFAVVLISIIVDVNRIRALKKVVRETGSQALAADVLHFSSDLAGSVMVLLGLIAAVCGFPYGDTLAAVGVAVFIAIAGWRLGRKTLETLLDTAPKGRAEELRALAEKTAGILAIESVRVRPGGNEVFAEITFAVSRALLIEQVSALKGELTRAVAAALPDTTLTLVAHPRALDSETVRDRVLLLAQRQHLPVHHVTVQQVAEKLSISFDMEVDGQMSMAEAHAKADFFDGVLCDEFGIGTEVEPHIEPLEPFALHGQDVAAEIGQRIEAALLAGADGSALSWDIHNVRVRETAPGLIVNYHCRAEGELTVAEVHRHLDEIEHDVREKYPEIFRIVGHADLRHARKR